MDTNRWKTLEFKLLDTIDLCSLNKHVILITQHIWSTMSALKKTTTCIVNLIYLQNILNYWYCFIDAAEEFTLAVWEDYTAMQFWDTYISQFLITKRNKIGNTYYICLCIVLRLTQVLGSFQWQSHWKNCPFNANPSQNVKRLPCLTVWTFKLYLEINFSVTD